MFDGFSPAEKVGACILAILLVPTVITLCALEIINAFKRK